MKKVKVGMLSEFHEGKIKGLEVEGKKILIANVKGELYAIDSMCSHEEGPLEEGEIDVKNCCVKCPWHHAVFDLKTGQAVEAPAEKPQEIYPVSVEGEEVFIEIG